MKEGKSGSVGNICCYFSKWGCPAKMPVEPFLYSIARPFVERGLWIVKSWTFCWSPAKCHNKSKYTLIGEYVWVETEIGQICWPLEIKSLLAFLVPDFPLRLSCGCLLIFKGKSSNLKWAPWAVHWWPLGIKCLCSLLKQMGLGACCSRTCAKKTPRIGFSPNAWTPLQLIISFKRPPWSWLSTEASQKFLGAGNN